MRKKSWAEKRKEEKKEQLIDLIKKGSECIYHIKNFVTDEEQALIQPEKAKKESANEKEHVQKNPEQKSTSSAFFSQEPKTATNTPAEKLTIQLDLVLTNIEHIFTGDEKPEAPNGIPYKNFTALVRKLMNEKHAQAKLSRGRIMTKGVNTYIPPSNTDDRNKPSSSVPPNKESEGNGALNRQLSQMKKFLFNNHNDDYDQNYKEVHEKEFTTIINRDTSDSGDTVDYYSDGSDTSSFEK